MKRSLLLIALTTVFLAQAPSQTLPQTPAPLSLERDGLALGLGTLGLLGTELWINLDPPVAPEMPFAENLEGVNAFDRSMMAHFNDTFLMLSNIGQYTCAALPFVLLFTEDSSYAWPLASMGFQALEFAFAGKDALKRAFLRPRPYVAYGDSLPPGEEAVDALYSMPSGHSAISFAGATVFAMAFYRMHPDSPWALPIIIGSYGLASATAAFRVLGGYHFTSDVIVGALVGFVAGWAAVEIRFAK